MAKKKASPQINEPKEQSQSQKDPDQDQTISGQASVEDKEEKLRNLKSLNSLLAREVFEKRQQIESLVKSKNALQKELARSKVDLEAELGRVSDENAELELEKLFFCVAMETHVREMCAGIDCLVREKKKRESEVLLLKGEVNELMGNFENEKDLSRRVILERDSVRSDLDLLVQEVSGLREKVFIMEKNERNLEENIELLEAENQALMESKKNDDNVIEVVTREKDKLERNLEERFKDIEDLQREIEEIAREKKKITMENGEQKLTINDLEKELTTLNEILLNSRKQEEMLNGKVLELEKSWGEGMEKQQDMATEIDALMGEKSEMESRIEKLIERTSSMARELEMTKMECDGKARLIEDLSREKNELLENNDNVIKVVTGEKDKLERNLDEKLKEIQALQGEVEEIAREKEKIQMETGAQKLTINDLEKELRALNEILLNSRKQEEMLSGKVLELEKSWGEGTEKQQDMAMEINALMEEKREVETHIEKLIEQTSCMSKELEMTKMECDEKAWLIEDLSRQKNELLERKKTSDNVIEVVTREKDKLERNLEEKLKEIQDLQGKIEEIAREKKEIQMENGAQKFTISDLEKELCTLNEILLNSRKEEEMLSGKVFELEKSWGEGMEKQQHIATEINALMEEKREMESRIAKLIERMDCMTEELEMTKTESDEKARFIEDLSRNKDELEGLKLCSENEVAELHGEVGQLRDVVLRLQELCQSQEEQNKKLKSEVGHFRDAFDQVTIEKVDALKSADEERKNGLKLMSKVSGVEKMIEETRNELARARSERGSIFEEKKVTDNHFELLRKEKDSMQMKLLARVSEMEKSIEETRKKLAQVRSERESVFGEKKELESHLELLRKEKDSMQMKLSAKISEMEKTIEETRKELAQRRSVCENVFEEKKELESRFELLRKEKDSVQMKLSAKVSEMEKRVEENRKELTHVRSERESVFEGRKEMESHFALLMKEKDSIQMKLSAKVSEMENIIEETRKELARVRGERESVLEGKKELESCFELLRKEKDSVQMKLSAKVSGMEKRIEETTKELARVRSERESLFEEKKEMEYRFKLLRKDKDSVQKELSEAKGVLNKLKAKMESVGMNSEQALTMLKNTAAVLCQSVGDCDAKDNLVTCERKLANETEQYASELEVIKKAFRRKETMVEDMKQQVELLQNSVADAQKRKSFWTVVSSATTVFAAISIAYVARAR